MWSVTLSPLASLLLAFLRLATATTAVQSADPTLQQQVDQLNSAMTNVTQALHRTQQHNEHLTRQLAQLQEVVLRHLTAKCNGDVSSNIATPSPPRNTSDGGATYIRWGRTSCPPESELVYRGYAGGSLYTHQGAAVNYLCLPEAPEYSGYSMGVAFVYGTEYQTSNHIFSNYNHDVPCALCRSPTRSSAVMIPAKISCYPGFHREYYGYLMAGKWDQTAATEYICVDRSPENVAGGQDDLNGALLHFVQSRCGSLKCPPYQEGKTISCVVCSK